MKQKFTRTVLLCLAILSFQAVFAAAQFLIVNQEGGIRATFALSDYPVITTANGEFEVATASKQIIAPLNEIVDYRFSETDPGDFSEIDEVNTDPATGKIIDGHVVFSGLNANVSVTVYDIAGRVIDTLRADADNCVDVDLSAYPHGIIIITAGNTSYKVLNK